MSKTNDNDFLAECEAKANEANTIAAKATPGRWVTFGMCVAIAREVGDESESAKNIARTYATDDHGRPRAFDANFIAHARTSNPDLAERVLQLVAMVRKLQEQVDDMEDRGREEADYRDWERD